MESSTGNETSKKVNFEDLSKEELVQKCNHLLGIAQKAKQSKSILQEEIHSLKDEIFKMKTVSSGTEEIINTLTQKNLSLTMTVDELNNHNKLISQRLEQREIDLRENQEKLFSLDNENGSFKRQISRLVEENEQLLTNLDTLEKQIEKLNQLGIEQQNQLLQLEKQNITEKNETALNMTNPTVLDELKNIKSENELLSTRILKFEEKMSQNNTIIIQMEEQLANKNMIITNLSSKLQELENSFKDNVNINENEIIQLNTENKTMKEKLRIYHSKIVKFAGIVKILREDKNNILMLSKSYIDQVKTWKDQLQFAKDKCLKVIKKLEIENEELKQELVNIQKKHQDQLFTITDDKRKNEIRFGEEIIQYQLQIESLNEKCSQILIFKKNLEDSSQLNSNLKIQIDKLCQEISGYKEDIEQFRKERTLIQKELNEETNSQLKEEIKTLELDNKEHKRQFEHLCSSEATLKNNLKDVVELVEEYKHKLTNLEVEKEYTTKEINELKNMIVLYESELTKLKNEHATVCESEKNILDELKLLQNEKGMFLTELKTSNVKYNCLVDEYNKDKSDYQKTVDALKHEIKSYKELGIKSSEEIEKLILENQVLLNKIEQLKQELLIIKGVEKDLKEVECQSDLILSSDVEQQVSDLRRENAELLSDMNEMNQELKERGENISKLSVHCEEVLKKLQVYETQANKNVDSITEKENVIEDLKKQIETLICNKNEEEHGEIAQLKAEIEILKEKLNQNFDSSVDAETMSTSTISRTEEINRLKDLEGSWEERYGKLRTLAIKLKGKIREMNTNLTQQQNENENLQKKFAVNIKTIQNLQTKCDTLEDELDKSQKECKTYLNRLNQVAHDISNDKQLLASKDEIINDLKLKVEQCNKEKQSTENWKKQVSSKIQTLRKELEAKELMRKELELKISELTTELQHKDELIRTESESHNHTKNLLEQLNDQCKKNSVLNLEMQDYERSMKEITKKMDKQQEHVVSLKSQIDSQKLIIETLKDENKCLEEKLSIGEQNLLAASSEITMHKSKISKNEENLKEKDEKIDSLTKLLETSRAEVEELSIELSKAISEHQKTDENLKNERDHLRNQNIAFQQNVRDLQDELKMKIDEFNNIQNEYDGYKIRAQSVLKQSQSRDIGLEEKLLEEINLLKTKNASLSAELDNYKDSYKKLEKNIQAITTEKDTYWKQINELESEFVELKKQYDQLQANHEKTLLENNESIRNLKVHAETLSQCYRQQLSEQEKQYSKELVDLKLRLDSVLTSTENVQTPPNLPREEAEGSESTESNVTSMYPIPLEKLLESESNQSIENMQKQLSEQESKVTHLTALLSETEKDLIKHIQMNNLLKEEIRRHQRSVEREKHAENLEYLKNVVVKFVTLSSGDERSRLVPVLNTILKLSPEETKQLTAVAKGESLLKGLSHYLPAWSPNKPQ